MTYLFFFAQIFIFIAALYLLARGVGVGRSYIHRQKNLDSLEERYESLRRCRRELLVNI